jgi:hypothetical protein
MIMKMAVIDARIGNEQRLASQAETNTLGDSGKHSGNRWPERPIKDPHGSKTVLPQQPRQSD